MAGLGAATGVVGGNGGENGSGNGGDNGSGGGGGGDTIPCWSPGHGRREDTRSLALSDKSPVKEGRK